MVTINQLVDMVMRDRRQAAREAAYPGPLGVRGRNSDNRLIREKLGWEPTQPLRKGLETTYQWIEAQTRSNSARALV